MKINFNFGDDYKALIYSNKLDDLKKVSFFTSYGVLLNNPNQTFIIFLLKNEFKKVCSFYKNGKKIVSFSSFGKIYGVDTYINDYNRYLNKYYNCPNCINLCDINKLLTGCPYCHTKFLVSNLYPIITNYYFIRYNTPAKFVYRFLGFNNNSENFKYDFFENKIISMLYDIIFSDNPTKLVLYTSKIENDFFKF